MVSSRLIVVALFLFAMMAFCLLENAEGHPIMGFGGGHHGGSGVANILAAGAVIHLLRNQG